jgi:hypothetical protein
MPKIKVFCLSKKLSIERFPTKVKEFLFPSLTATGSQSLRLEEEGLMARDR